MNKQRARKAEDKEARRQAALEAARHLSAQTTFAQLTMAEVAQQAGLAKGTIYLYFATKEHLFLALLEQMLAEWFDVVDKRLAQERGTWDVARVVRVIGDSLSEQEQLIRLLALLESVLEHNIDLATAQSFKQSLAVRMATTGALLEQRLAFLKKGGGPRLLLHMRALLTGLWQMADNAPVIQEVIASQAEMKVFQIDFKREFKAGLSALIYGFEQTSKTRT